MNPDTFKGKVILQIIDKIILGLLVTLVVLFIQSKIDTQNKLFNQAVSVSTIKTEYLMEQNNQLTKTVADYFVLVNRMKSLSQKTDQDIIQLRELFSNIKLFSTLASIGGNDVLNKMKEKLHTAIEDLNKKLQRNEAQDKIESKSREVLGKYTDFLTELQSLVIKTTEDEFSKIPIGFLWWD